MDAEKLTDKNRKYNAEREAQNNWAKRDFDKEKILEEIYNESFNNIQSKVDEFYLKYAKKEGLTRLEAMKTLKSMDVSAWANEAAKTVQQSLHDKKFNKDMYDYNKKHKLSYFSPETEKWLRAYNSKMKISRLELLKGEIEIELQKMYAQEGAVLSYHLTEEYLEELRRQAGILGNSAAGSSKRINEILNADFYGNNWSEKVWGRNGHYQELQKDIFGSLNRIYTNMDGYKKERDYLAKKYKVTKGEAMRLLKTESARIRAHADEDSYRANGFTHYRFVAESGACKVCAELDSRLFKVEDAEIGVTMFPMHPSCRCSTYGIIEMKRKDGSSNLDEYR